MQPAVLLDAVIDDLRTAGQQVELRSMDTAPSPALVDATHDSRKVADGVLFCAVPGERFDGHDFAAGAVASGAPALLVERFVDVDIAQLRVDRVRAAMPIAAATVHRHPSEELAVVGVTGTNGKTTTTHLLAAILRSLGRIVDVVGTLGGVHTTPEATDLQRRFRADADAGVDIVAAEVSSHALDQHRADAVSFAVAAFSNLTPDHLDYHRDMASYFDAKRRLFDGRAAAELINVDDEWGRRLADERPSALRLSLESVQVVVADARGTTFEWRGQQVRLPMPGMMNVANALMAAEAAMVLGGEPEAITAGLAATPQVPGRMELVEVAGAPVTAIVDYSHTPDSIERALAAIRASAPDAFVTIVFGCGGDRDRAKRPLMGRAAEAGADLVIVTSDNPRSEDPTGIIDDAVAGMLDPTTARIEVDRRSAIRLAAAATPPGGVVLVAGKGHEQTQTIGDEALPFDDVAEAAAALEELLL
ncbi:MAG: UDP-N-acetylmuramoyl-L-alanyl-D-glutamate--2,6-diaminopimelate ligase [Actinomycetota bacterium]